MIARSAAPPARETGAFKGRRRHPRGLAAIEIARPWQALARLFPRTGRASGIGIGAGWNSGGQGEREDDVGLTLAHPDIGPPACKIKLGRATGQGDDDVFALIWNPED